MADAAAAADESVSFFNSIKPGESAHDFLQTGYAMCSEVMQVKLKVVRVQCHDKDRALLSHSICPHLVGFGGIPAEGKTPLLVSLLSQHQFWHRWYSLSSGFC